jgi:hypothetical protein
MTAVAPRRLPTPASVNAARGREVDAAVGRLRALLEGGAEPTAIG